MEDSFPWEAQLRSVLDFVARHPDRPFVFVTSRINLAHKLQADLESRGIDVHNYKDAGNASTAEWIERGADAE